MLNTQYTDNCPPFHPPLPFLPIALPRVPHICVMDAVLICLLIQEIKHILDGQRQRAAAVHGAEQRLKQVVHKFLQRTLMGAATEKVKGGTGACLAKQRWQEGTPDGVASSAQPCKVPPATDPTGISKVGVFTNTDCAAGGPGENAPACSYSRVHLLFISNLKQFLLLSKPNLRYLQ